MNADERVIPSRRGSLIIQRLVVIFLAAGVGLFLQSWIDAEEFVALLQQRTPGLAAPKAAHGT